MGIGNTSAFMHKDTTFLEKSHCKVILSVKEGANYRDTDMVLDTRDEKLITYFSDGLFTINSRKKQSVKFITPNLKSGFKTVPETSIFSNSLKPFNFIEIDYAVKASEGVNVAIQIFWYSGEALIKTTPFYLEGKGFSSALSHKEMIAVPDSAQKMGLHILVSGVGKVKVSKLRVRRSKGLIKNPKSSVPPKPSVSPKPKAVIKPHLKLEQKTNLTPALNNLSGASKINKKPKKLNRIKVHPAVARMSQDADPFIQDAILHAIAHHPELSNNPFKLVNSLIKDKREHAALNVVRKYETDFGIQVHQLNVNILYASFNMAELITYYKALPLALQDAPFFVRRYQIALAWTGQNQQLHKSIAEKLCYPEIHRSLIPNFIRYAELLDNSELKVVTQIILNNAVQDIQYFNLLSFYDLLIHRGLIDVAQSLTSLLQSKIGEGKGEGRINHALMSANIAFRNKSHSKQLHYINLALGASRLLPLSLRDAQKPLSANNVYCEKNELYNEKVTSSGPLVTVIMTTWNSTGTLDYAVSSILEQTHRNIELIIVDDASSDKTPQAIKALAKKDTRIVPILLKKNGGTYVAKNHGRALAKGEFITCQDSDDWAHPQKIERLVSVLSTNEQLVGVECGHVRISEQDGIQRRPQGYLKPDASSLMYRREIIENSVGFYDSVRAGADGEFKTRLLRYFGPEAFKFQKELLSIVAWTEGTLSGRGSEFEISAFGVFSKARLAYRKKFYRSHEYGLFQKGKTVLYRNQDEGEVHVFGPKL